MVFEVRAFPRAQVKEVIREERPFTEYLRRAGALRDDDLEGRFVLAEWCDEEKLKDEREIELLKILAADPEHDAALRALGRSKFRKAAKGNPDFDPAVKAAIDEYLAIADPEEREKAYGRMKRELSVDRPREYFDRIIRSTKQPAGLEKDRPLTLRAAEHPGVYTIYVPKAYDARRAWPLIIGLHGGGVGGKEGDEVVGSGDSAMNFYVRQAEARGYLVVCPNARALPWRSTANADYLPAILEEICLLYHVDLNRIYLTGHSAGGFGTWHFGPQMAETWAAVSPMAGGGSGVKRLEETNTPIFIFHGADDGVVGPGSDRAQAKLLAKGKHDFVYTELAGVGHGFPDSIQNDLFDFFDVRRLARKETRWRPSAEVRSSFLVKVSRDEKTFLGDPLEFGAADAGGWKRLLKEMALGGGKAEAAADRLGEQKPEDAVKPLGDLVRNPATAEDVKVQAARALGLIGNPDGYKGLAAGLASESHEVFTAAARAMPKIGAEKGGDALVSSLGHLLKVVEGKRIGSNRMHISDWEPWLEAFVAAIEGIATLKPDGGAEAIRRTAVKGVVVAGWDVIYSQRVGPTPQRAMRWIALAAAEALGKLGGPEARAALGEMKAAQSDDAEITAACDAALATLSD
jgi:pimeloyl-ACP methyl ester carboxylesterase/HEAT repeat protein